MGGLPFPHSELCRRGRVGRGAVLARFLPDSGSRAADVRESLFGERA